MRKECLDNSREVQSLYTSDHSSSTLYFVEANGGQSNNLKLENIPQRFGLWWGNNKSTSTGRD